MADSAVEWGGSDLPGALEVRRVRASGKEVSEADPDFIDRDPAAVCVDIEVRGNHLAGVFSVELLDPHGVHQKADCGLDPAPLVLGDRID